VPEDSSNQIRLSEDRMNEESTKSLTEVVGFLLGAFVGSFVGFLVGDCGCETDCVKLKVVYEMSRYCLDSPR
jgi:hypothetical protein